MKQEVWKKVKLARVMTSDMTFSKVLESSVLATQMEPIIFASIQVPKSSGVVKSPYQLIPQGDFGHPVLFRVQTIFDNEDHCKSDRGEHENVPRPLKLSPEDQLTQFMTNQQLTTEQLRQRWQLATDLLFLLRKRYRFCELYVFGSLLSGLGDTNSDIDIYMDYKGDGGKFLDKQRPVAKFNRIFELQETVGDILKNAQCPHDPSIQFSSQVELIGFRVPIVRLQHAPTGISCDLSFGNGISVQNTKLFKFYMDFDPRVKPLIVFLRFWADFHGLSGSRKIKKYALSLLALVYLTRKKILPSINLLQILAAAERSKKGKLMDNQYLIDGWDASFCSNPEMIETLFEAPPLPPNYENNSTHILLQMAREFFELMLNTDFANVVVCPLLGKMVSKDDFINKDLARNNLPRRLKEWRMSFGTEKFFCKETKILNPLVIQDPFDLDFNVSGLVRQSTLDAFKNACLSTLKDLKTKFE